MHWHSLDLLIFQNGKKYILPYVVYEKVWRCEDYPPDGIVTFVNISVECDGSDCTDKVAWESKVNTHAFHLFPHMYRPKFRKDSDNVSMISFYML